MKKSALKKFYAATKYWLIGRWSLMLYCRGLRKDFPLKDYTEVADRLSWNLPLVNPHFGAAIQRDMKRIVYSELTGVAE